MANMTISARDLAYRYGDLTAVDPISFKVAEGEVLGFLGPNGAGKTTAVNRMLSGQLAFRGQRHHSGRGHPPVGQASAAAPGTALKT